MNCLDCKESQGTVKYFGGERCAECAKTFDEFNRLSRRWFDSQPHRCEECREVWTGSDHMGCPNCCAHDFDPDEGNICLNCGTDGSERVMSAAYDRAKDIRKYGE